MAGLADGLAGPSDADGRARCTHQSAADWGWVQEVFNQSDGVGER